MNIIYNFLILCIFILAIAPTFINNPVHAVIFFILVFLLVAGILITIGIEFLAFVYAIVYIGAVAVLFLFVVMLLQVSRKYQRPLTFPWVLILILGLNILCLRIITLLSNTLYLYISMQDISNILPEEKIIASDFMYNNHINSKGVPIYNELHAIADKLYTTFDILFIETAFILLVALIAVIVLTKTELVATTFISRQAIKNA